MSSDIAKAGLRTFLDGLADGVCLSDETGKVLFANRAARSLLSRAEPLKSSKRICDLFCKRMQIHGTDSPADCSLRVPSTTGTTATFRGRLPVRKTKGGPNPEQDGMELRVRGVRLAGKQLANCRVTLIEDVAPEAESEKRREDWRGMVAHDLRSPLTNVLGALRMIEELPIGHRLEAHDRELIGFGVRAALKIRTLVDEYLEVARVESGGMMVNRACIDTARLASDAAADIREQARAVGIDVRLDIPDSLYCEGDPSILARVLQNLLDNALKFTPHGGRVTISVDSKDDKVFVSVADTGRGIPAVDLPHIFDRYYQGEGVGRTKGLGLGLTFCQEALQAMNGRIGVESTLGKGSVFTIKLPLAGGELPPLTPEKNTSLVSESRAGRCESRSPSHRRARRRYRSAPARAAR